MHTSGPWHLLERSVEPFGHTIYAGEGDTPSEWTIADTYIGDVGSDREAANARLICAAPSLLAVAQEILSACEATLVVDDKARTRPLYNQLRAAIAKATGQDS